MLNKQMVIGRLTRDPELRYIKVKGEDTAVCNFSIASDEDRGDGTDFVNVVVWRQQAETVAKYLTKGRLVYVEGRPKTRSYPITKDGVEFNNNITEIQNATVQFLDSAKKTEARDEVAVPAGQAPEAGDDSVPF